jgi:hypothetical protein
MAKFITKKYPADSIMAEMGIDIGVNTEGRVLVLHEQHFQSPVIKLEYQQDNGHLGFMMEDGTIRDFGMPAPPSIQNSLAKAEQAYLLLVENNKIAGYHQVPVHQVL